MTHDKFQQGVQRHNSFRFLYALTLFLCILGLYRTTSLIVFSAQHASVYNLGIDTPTYQEMAKEVATHGVSAITPIQPPGYVWYLSHFYRWSDSPIIAVKLVNILCVLIIALCVWSIGTSLWGPYCGALSAVLVCNSAALRAYSATIQYEVFVSMLLMVVVYMAIRLPKLIGRSFFIYLFAAALLLSVLTLTREPCGVFFISLCFAIVFSKRALRERSIALCILLSSFLVPISLWIVHQYHAYGIVVPISEKSSTNFPIGNNPHANGTYNLVRTSIGSPAGWDYIVSAPMDWIILEMRKLGYLVGILRDGWNVPDGVTILLWKIFGATIDYSTIMLLVRILPVILAMWGMVIAVIRAKHREDVYLLLIPLALYGASFLPFIGSYRFLVPVSPILCIFIAISLQEIVMSFMSSIRTRRLFLVLACLSVVLFYETNSLKLSFATTDLDGVALEDIQEGGQSVLFAPAQQKGRLVAFFPHEFFPRGTYVISADYRSTLSELAENTRSKYGKITVRRFNGSTLCSLELLNSTEYYTNSLTCTLPRTEPIAIEIRSAPRKGDFWLRALRVSRVS